MTASLKIMTVLAPALLLLGSHARALPSFETIAAEPLRETWLNAGFYSYHFKRDKGLNDSNPGVGAEYRYSSVSSFAAGRFYNSDRQYSNYAVFYYQPVAIGRLRLGAAGGVFDGYPHMRGGRAFLAALPVASVEFGRFGINFGVTPNYKDRLYGALSLQLKLKVGD